MDRPMRSLIDPPGFIISSFRNSSHGPVSMRRKCSIGVWPIISRAFEYTCMLMLLTGMIRRALARGNALEIGYAARSF
jgi:hypothetical protein